MRDRANVSIKRNYEVVDCLSESTVILDLWRLLAEDKILLSEDFMHIKTANIIAKNFTVYTLS